MNGWHKLHAKGIHPRMGEGECGTGMNMSSNGIPSILCEGIQRPFMMTAGMLTVFAVLYRASGRPCYKKLLSVACVGYLFALVYATFLSRTAAESYDYRLQLMGSTKRALAEDGGLWVNFWRLLHGKLVSTWIDRPRSREGLLINLLLTVPIGYLLPQILHGSKRRVKGWQVLLAGSLCSALIEGMQLITRLGMLDIEDWLLNTVGTGGGYVLFQAICRHNKKKSRGKNGFSKISIN